MEALKKQNEDLATRLTLVEGRNSRRDQEREKRCAREQERVERRKQIHRGKRTVGLEDQLSSVHGSHHTID